MRTKSGKGKVMSKNISKASGNIKGAKTKADSRAKDVAGAETYFKSKGKTKIGKARPKKSVGDVTSKIMSSLSR